MQISHNTPVRYLCVCALLVSSALALGAAESTPPDGEAASVVAKPATEATVPAPVTSVTEELPEAEAPAVVAAPSDAAADKASDAAADEQAQANAPVVADAGFSAEERAVLAQHAAAGSDPLARQRAGEFYEEPLFWGGVGAVLLLLLLL